MQDIWNENNLIVSIDSICILLLETKKHTLYKMIKYCPFDHQKE